MKTRADLRSDTLTLPIPAMRQAMSQARVGDDVYGEDPTVRALQERVASLLGKEAALFLPSGTMANQVAIAACCQPGDELIIEAHGHAFYFESGSPAALAGAQCHPVAGDDGGRWRLEQVEEAIRPEAYYLPRTRLVVMENTHNLAGGTIQPQETVEAVGRLCRERGLYFHLDGARLFNAAVASGREVAELAAPATSVNVCLSKGLGAPVGSCLAAGTDLIREAHRLRKRFGGGMRQAGILAAAGLFALEHHVERLAEDHRRARDLARGICRLPGISVDPERVETNIVRIGLGPAAPAAPALAARLAEQGVRLNAIGPRALRAVTHLDIDDGAIAAAVTAFARALA